MQFFDEYEGTGKLYSIGLSRRLFDGDGDPMPTRKKKIKKRKRDPHKPKGAKSGGYTTRSIVYLPDFASDLFVLPPSPSIWECLTQARTPTYCSVYFLLQ